LKIRFFLLLAILVISLPQSLLSAADPELRACWVTRFQWPGSSEATTKSNIRNIMSDLAEANFNSVLFQVRGQCDTYYPNPYEPWSSTFGWTDPGWDPLAYAIEQAHNKGLEFYAYINTHTMMANFPPAVTTPQHIYNLHGPSAQESWVIHDESGTPVYVEDAYVWLSPGVPQASAWTRQAIQYVVENYDIDGLHFDRIRTPAPIYSHDPITEARFAGDGNPDGSSWGDFMRSQITRDLRKIYGETLLKKPHVKVTAAPFGICKKVPDGYQGYGTESYYSWHQDSFGWMQSHVVDAIFPMIYWEIGSSHPYEVLLNDFVQRKAGRHIYAGPHTKNNEIAQIEVARSLGAEGTCLFSYGTLDRPSYMVPGGIYTRKAPIPDMPWKSDPQTGNVVGKVRYQSTNNPALDAVIKITGDHYNYLSAFDGFYSILDKEPGTYTVQAQKGELRSLPKQVTIGKGDVYELDLILYQTNAFPADGWVVQ
jgi:uncharacterized lipoprotein YddW (UPF0748 family)